MQKAYWQALRHGYSAVVGREGIHLHSNTPIRTTEWQGNRVPSDPLLAQYVGFLVGRTATGCLAFPAGTSLAETRRPR